MSASVGTVELPFGDEPFDNRFVFGGERPTATVFRPCGVQNTFARGGRVLGVLDVCRDFGKTPTFHTPARARGSGSIRSLYKPSADVTDGVFLRPGADQSRVTQLAANVPYRSGSKPGFGGDLRVEIV